MQYKVFVCLCKNYGENISEKHMKERETQKGTWDFKSMIEKKEVVKYPPNKLYNNGNDIAV